MEDSHTTGDLETIQQLEAELMAHQKIIIETNPESSFTPVKKGVPSRAIAKSAMDFKTPNAFELLQDDDEDDTTHDHDGASPVPKTNDGIFTINKTTSCPGISTTKDQTWGKKNVSTNWILSTQPETPPTSNRISRH